MERCYCFWIFSFTFISLLELTNGCANKQFNSGTSTEHFELKTTIQAVLALVTYTVEHNDLVKISASFFNGSLKENVSTESDFTLTGSVSAGDFSFKLSGVSTAKTGVYTLYGANRAKLRCVKLYILRKPSTPDLSSGSVPEIGRKLTFTCSSSSTTVPNDHGLSLTYTWSINGQTDLTGSRYTYNGNNLTITNVQKTDKDKPVSCTATEGVNGEQETSDTSNLLRVDVYYGPSSIIFNPANLSYVVRSGVVLPNIKCSADCHPGCSYVWYKDNTVFSRTSTLSLGRLSATDAATYRCRASRQGNAQTTERTLAVHVIYGPSNMFPTEGAVHTGNIGGNLPAINCSAHCWECQYKWIGPARSTKLGTGSNLILTNLDTTHDGTYTCTATNTRSGATNTTYVTVKVRYGPKSVIFSPLITSPLTVVEGVHQDPISCFSNCYPKCSASWKKGTQSTSLAKDEVLYFGYVNRSYAGNFICTSTNDATQYKKSLGKILSLVVQYPPDAIITLQNGSIREITLKCLANGEPPKYDFEEWVQMAPDGQTEIQKYVGQVSGGENMLILKNVTYMDSGVYTCKVSNPISASTAHVGKDNKEINVADKPFVIEDDREYDAKQHGNVTISVRFYSSDSIKNITWIKIINETKTPIDSDNKYTTSITSEPVIVPFYTKNITLQGNRSKLHIQDVEVDDYADFEVHIQNSVAEEVIILVVKPRDPPEVPRNFTLLQNSETTSSIEFSWFPGFHGGADQTFYIEYKPKGQGWRERASLFGGKIQNRQFQLKVDGLEPGSSYSFRIYSRNEHGNSSDTSQTLLGNTTNETVTPKSASLSGPAVGGGLGAAVLIVLVIVGIVFVKRRLPKKSQAPTKSILVKDDRNGEANKESDFSEVNNPAYVAADEAVTYKANDVYAVVDKSNKQKGALTANSAAEIYTKVQKPKKGKLDKADGPSTSLCSMPVKPKGKQAKEKKQKHGKKTKGGKHKDGIQGQVNEALVYENSEQLRRNGTEDENVYELTQCCSESSKLSRTKNEEGLTYVTVDFPQTFNGKATKPFIIHGIDDQNEYADIALRKVGEPAPESDDEDKAKEENSKQE